LTEDHPFHKLYVMLSLCARLMLGTDGWGGYEGRGSDGKGDDGLTLTGIMPLSKYPCFDGEGEEGRARARAEAGAGAAEEEGRGAGQSQGQSQSQSSPAECFLSTHSSSLLALSPLDLLKCADLALCPEARGRSEVVARGVLRLAVQLLMRKSLPSYVLLGNLYRRLVELSPDKTDVGVLLLIYYMLPPFFFFAIIN
jgi:hypothetical protein